MSDVEQVLTSTSLDWPVADVTSQVMGRVSVTEKQKVRWLRPVLAFVAVVVLLVATPPGRSVVANVLEIAGISIGWGEVTPGDDLDLGEPANLEDLDVPRS